MWNALSYGSYVSYEYIHDVIFKTQLNRINECTVVLIGGCSQSGKSTLANKLQEDLHGNGVECCIIRLDSWIKDIRFRTGTETVRGRYDYESIVVSIRRLLAGSTIMPPLYDSKTRRVTNTDKRQSLRLGKAGVAVVEGVVALDIEPLREEIAGTTIFVDVPDRIRKDRLRLFYTEYKCCNPEETERIIASREQEEVLTIKRTMVYADYVYLGSKQMYWG